MISSAPISPDKPVLVVDDDEGICLLLATALKKEGFPVEWKTTGAAALSWLREHGASLMLLDLRLADMRGQDLVDILSEEGRSIPFIIISGFADVRVAVEMMQEGALDFLPKDTQLLQLVVPIVRRSLMRIEERRHLADIEGRFLRLAENIQSVFWISTPDMTGFQYVSPAYARLWGFPAQAGCAQPACEHPEAWMEAVMPADLPALTVALDQLKNGADQVECEFRILRPDGEIRWLHCTASPLRDAMGQIDRLSGIVNDITERKEINRRLLAAAELERRRLGQDLHDDLCQRLAAIKLRCGMLERDLSVDGSPRASVAGELAGAIAEATALSRSFARGLAPVALDSEGLVSALQVLTASASMIFGLPVHFECPEPVTVSDPDTATHLYRIAQELIANAARHARPDSISVSLIRNAEGLILEVVNDGLPFAAGESTGEGMGLHFLRLRADAIGAALEFVPGPPPCGGTRVRCVISNSPEPILTK